MASTEDSQEILERSKRQFSFVKVAPNDAISRKKRQFKLRKTAPNQEDVISRKKRQWILKANGKREVNKTKYL
uniref:Uncharacterized protein n=1 Tax=Meloidogyne enterolobii TaxID=390850 RepID=A0A6V7W4R2_MELEN|nr:unnamed protein product [Meloidogyne enterolobii]